MQKDINCTVLGDPILFRDKHGKKFDIKDAFIMHYIAKNYSDGYMPTVFDDFKIQIEHQGEYHNLHLTSISGQEEYDRFRPMSYARANVLIIIYGEENPISLENIECKWLPELNHFKPDTPIILVGISNSELLSVDDKQALDNKIGKIKKAYENIKYNFTCDLNDMAAVGRIIATASQAVLKPVSQRNESIVTRFGRSLSNLFSNRSQTAEVSTNSQENENQARFSIVAHDNVFELTPLSQNSSKTFGKIS